MIRRIALLAAVFAITVSAAVPHGDADRLRTMLRSQDFEGVLHEFAALRNPSTEAQALNVAALMRSGAREDALAIAEKMKNDHPDDPWAWYAFAAAVGWDDDRFGEKPGATETMMRLAGGNPPEDMVALRSEALRNDGKRKEGMALLEGASTPWLRLVRIQADVYQDDDKDHIDEALPALAELRKEDPGFVAAYYEAASLLRFRRRWDDAYPLLKQAAALTPSLQVHRLYWDALRGLKDKSDADRKAEIDADVKSLLETRGDWPEVLAGVANVYRTEKRDDEAEALIAKLLQIAPESRATDTALFGRVDALMHGVTPQMMNDPAFIVKFRKALQDFIAYPHHAAPRMVAMAYTRLASSYSDHPENVTDAEFLEAAHGMEEWARTAPTVYASVYNALADRSLDLAGSEMRLRKMIESETKLLAAEAKTNNDPMFEKMANTFIGSLRDTLAWTLFKQGKTDLARTQLLAAYELLPDNETVLYHMGALAEAANQLDKAEGFYRRGMGLQTPRKNPNPAAIKALYVKRHGSESGFDTYIANLDSRNAVTRKTKVLGERVKSPKSAPDFTFRTLDGKKLAMADLKGKVAVINFWGLWCGWCLREMPDYQALAKKYRDDPNVRVLTINNDGDDRKVKDWMKQQKYDFAVLVDDGFARKQNVSAYPTTWFLDPRGRIAFEKKGWTEKLVEEFSWRIEALR